MTSSIATHALALVLAAGLNQGIAPPLGDDWANRLLAEDPKVRATAEGALVEGGRHSLPLLRRFLDRDDQDLNVVTFEIIQRIGPPAIPLLVDLPSHPPGAVRSPG